jgi:hypothetical protein
MGKNMVLAQYSWQRRRLGRVSQRDRNYALLGSDSGPKFKKLPGTILTMGAYGHDKNLALFQCFLRLVYPRFARLKASIGPCGNASFAEIRDQL